MTELTIDRLLTRAEVGGADDQATVRRLVADLTGRELERALASARVPDGLWCLRRLDVDLRLDGRGDGELGRDWARAVVEALLEGLSPAAGVTSPDVVGYARHEQLLADVVAELARGRTERAWAWRMLGAVAEGDPDPGTDARAAVLAALARRPQAIVPVLADALTWAGLAPVHRLLGSEGWEALAGLVLSTAGVLSSSWLADPAPDPHAVAGPAAATVVVNRSRIARTWRASGVRPGLRSTRALALLAVAEAEPALLRRPDAALLDAVVAAADPEPGTDRPGLLVSPESLEGAATVLTPGGEVPLRRGEAAPPPPRPAERGPDAPDAGGARAVAPTGRPRPDEQPPGTPTTAGSETPRPYPTTAEDLVPGEVTDLGGAVYLLATAEEAGVPDAVLDDPALSALPPSAVLRHLLVMITGADPRDDDPALRALAGPGLEAPVAVGADVRDALAPHVDRWRQVTALRLGDDDPRAVVRALVRRRGRVVVAPGWVEFHMRLDEVDLGVRRAGLDVDPGFVPWLGSVVVIRYA